jgi:hypothetical protein
MPKQNFTAADFGVHPNEDSSWCQQNWGFKTQSNFGVD